MLFVGKIISSRSILSNLTGRIFHSELQQKLVGGLVAINLAFSHRNIGNFFHHPSFDEVIFFRGVAFKPPTSSVSSEMILRNLETAVPGNLDIEPVGSKLWLSKLMERCLN